MSKGDVTESIFSGASVVIPMAEVMFIERDMRKDWKAAITVVFRGSTWNVDADCWNNISWLQGEEASAFKAAWCRYRHELEKDTLETDQ